MKYCVVVLLTTLAFVVIAVEARTKRKFDSDFTFAEDVSDALWLKLTEIFFILNSIPVGISTMRF